MKARAAAIWLDSLLFTTTLKKKKKKKKKLKTSTHWRLPFVIVPTFFEYNFLIEFKLLACHHQIIRGTTRSSSIRTWPAYRKTESHHYQEIYLKGQNWPMSTRQRVTLHRRAKDAVEIWDVQLHFVSSINKSPSAARRRWSKRKTKTCRWEGSESFDSRAGQTGLYETHSDSFQDFCLKKESLCCRPIMRL